MSKACEWRVRGGVLTFGRRPRIMGIVNVTPDSFSDGGRFLEHDRAIKQGLRLVDEGADLLDIGGESTRPYSEPVAVEEELRRVLPVVERLASRTSVPLSIDTSKARVARAALDAGAAIINDVTGLEGDPEMAPVAVELGAGVCIMHMRGTPQTMQDDPQYDNVVTEVLDYLRSRRDALLGVGLEQERICLDPGIGFGKTHAHSLELLRHAERFHSLGCPVLVGHSRKGFIGKVQGDPDVERTSGTVGAALALALRGVQVIRVHDVGPLRRALLLFEAAGGLDIIGGV